MPKRLDGTVFGDYIGEIKMRQQAFEFRTWGGKREGAGRPPKGKRAGAPHKRRPWHDRNHPVHVTVRVVERVGRLRRRDGYRAIRRAMIRSWEREDFRICQFSIQGNHIHMIVEADDAKALARGMQGFEISCAKHLNGALGKRGQVFADRYHPVVLATPQQVRNALSYVLNNWRKHGEDGRYGRAEVDPYSSGKGFDGWNRPVDRRIRPDDELVPVKFADSWLLTVGWRRRGLISPAERPAAKAWYDMVTSSPFAPSGGAQRAGARGRSVHDHARAALAPSTAGRRGGRTEVVRGWDLGVSAVARVRATAE
jgi:REP element-mobilizing transposase RayT